MATIKEISKACGVSPATVSKALNGYSDVSEATIEKVRRCAEELHYMPNAAARQLKTNTSHNIGVIYRDNTGSGLAHEYFSGVLDSAKAEAEKVAKEKAKFSSGKANGHEYVDLGLPSGLKWATCNVGATKPEGDGKYFSWGETKGTDPYSSNWNDYPFHETKKGLFSKKDVMIKYNEKDKKTILEGCDDIARVQWKGKWRMPTIDDFQELLHHCKSKWEKLNGIKGRSFTGPNGRKLFLPVCCEFDERRYVPFGAYWSSTLLSSNPDEVQYALTISFDSKKVSDGNKFRYNGLHIRPVMD